MRALLTRPGLATTGRSQIPGVWAVQKEAPKAVLWGLSHFQPPVFKAMMANRFLF